MSAQEFHDSVGVNAHDTYFNTPYGNWAQAIGVIKRLGIGHIRVGIYDSSNPDWNARHWGDLKAATAAGLKLDVLVGPDCSYLAVADFADCLNVLSNRVGLKGVESVEWPNESSAPELSAWGHTIYGLAHNLGLPVVGPSLTGNPAALGNQSDALDFGNLHDYTGATSPTPDSVRSQESGMAAVAGTKPDVATEFGFHTVPPEPTNPDQPGIDQHGQAVYALRQLLEHLADGIDRSYIYELYDEFDNANTQSNYGLVRAGGTLKPAGRAIANLLAMVGRGGPRAVSPLAFTLEDTDRLSDLRYLTVEKHDGTYLLILWRTASVWNRNAQKDIAVTASTIHIDGLFSDWAAGDPITSRRLVDGSGPVVAVRVGADPVVVRISP